MQAIKRLSIAILIVTFLCHCDEEDEKPTPYQYDNDGGNPVVTIGDLRLETIADGFDIPWGVEVMGEDELLFTERSGSLYHYLDGEVDRVTNVPSSQTFTTSGGLVMAGLMDVSLHPQYATNQLVYIAYVANDNLLTISRFRLENNKVEDLERIFKANKTSVGSRIIWEDNDHFFFSVGIGGDPFPEPGPQDLDSDQGKIHRLMADGSVPEDNPVFSGQSEPSSIWTYGHRNPQGLYYDALSQTLYANEHGPYGGDELNEVFKGENYGWPLFSYGLNYDGSLVSDMTEAEAEEMSVLPIKYWDYNARVSPSGLLKLEGSNFSDWNGSFLMGSLFPQNLLRYDMETDETELVLEEIGRVRDVAQFPGGDLLIMIDARSPNSTDAGRLVKISPAE